MKYEEYKYSGIEWIGEMPSHWRVMPIKRTGSFENGLTYSPTDICDDNGVLVLRSSNIQNDKLSFEDNVYVAKCPLSLMVKSGDIIICSRNGSASLVGKCAMVEGNINATYGAFMMRYRPICKSNKVFSYYLLQTALKCYKGLYSTTTINQLTKGVIGQIYVSYPPFHEQQAIATYLDEKCGEINRAIDVQKKKINLLNELKQTIITDTVTKGLDPNAPMKDSGVEWIGEIPEHWENKRLRFIIKAEKGKNPAELSYEQSIGMLPYLSMECLRGSLENQQYAFIDKNSILVKENDIILLWDGSNAGEFIFSKDGILCSTCAVLHINEEQKSWFFYYCKTLEPVLKSLTNGMGIPHVNPQILLNSLVPIPTIIEQQNIVKYLDEECTKIDVQISKVSRHIELLEELKQSIITEAVTGKIKVC